MFVLSVFAVPAAATHDPKDPESDTVFEDTNFAEEDSPPEEDGQTFATRVRKAFDPAENFPDTLFDETGIVGENGIVGEHGVGDPAENFPDTLFDGDEEDEFEDGTDPVISP